MNEQVDVVCVGLMVADIIAGPLDNFHFAVDTTRVESIAMQNGGDALNAAIVLGKLGVKSAIVGKIGDDDFGRFLLAKCRDAGVHAGGVVIAPGEKTSSVLVLRGKSGERVFIYHGGTNDRLCEDDIDFTFMGRAGIAHFGGVFALPALENGLANILRRVKQSGKTTTMDVTWDTRGKWLAAIKSALPHLDYFLPSINEARAITGKEKPGEIAAALLDLGVGTVIVKLGAAGCYARTAGEELFAPGFIVPQVVDTTGAGDSFVAGFLAGLSRGWDLRACADFANAAGALCVMQTGATQGVVNFEQTWDYCRKKKG